MSREQVKAFIDQQQTGCKKKGDKHSEKVMKPHFPVKEGHRHFQTSGATLGPGIDIGNRSSEEINKLFSEVLPQQQIDLLQEAAGLKGKQAENWVMKNKDKIRLDQKGYGTLFDRELDQKDKTLNRIFSSKQFKNKFKIDGQELLKKMDPKYKIVLYDTLYLGRNTVKTREQIVPGLVKIHKNEASSDDIAKLNQRIVDLYNGHKKRGENINNLISQGNQMSDQKQNFNNSQKVNRQFKDTFTRNTNQKLNDLLHNKTNQKLGGVDFAYDFSSMKINGFKLSEKIMKMHLQQIGENPFLRDLIVPLKIYYDDKIQYKNLSISIDPLDPYNPDGPLYQKVYYPKEMEGTYYAQMMVEADYVMKQLILGLDDKGKPFKYPQSLKNVGLALQNQIQYIDTMRQRTRQWIVIKKVHFLQDANNCIQIGEIQMGLQARVQQVTGEGRLADAQRELGTRIKKFCELFTQHYSILEKEYQVFKIVKRLAKAAVLSRLMVQRRCPINFRLINELFELQKTDKSSKIIPKLSNCLELTHKQLPLLKYSQQITIKIQLIGGCDLSFQPQMAIMDSNKKNTEATQEDYLPFPFQSYIECEEESCENICSNQSQQLIDTKCSEHTINICQLCWHQIRQNEVILLLNDGRRVHKECMHCEACYGYIDGNYAQQQSLFYHPKCAPRVSVGLCYVCGSDVFSSEERLLSNNGLIHSSCAQNFECFVCKAKASILNLININEKFYHKQCVKCIICRDVITGQIKYSSNGFLHDKCIPRVICESCQKQIQGAYQKLDNKSYHPECLVCFKCKLPLTGQIKLGQGGKFYHSGC